MNPHASLNRAGRLLVALAAVSALLFATGCGSSSSTSVNKEGYSVSNLNGTYVFSSEGADASGDTLVLTGAFTTDGKGDISAGTMDVIDQTVGIATGQAITACSSCYSVNQDGRGQVALAAAGTTFTLDFVLTTTSGGVSSHGLVTEFDGIGSGSGAIYLQTAITSLTTGNYAFSLAGTNFDANPLATVGAFALTSTGTTGTLTGQEDFNNNLTVPSVESLTGTATLGTGTGPGTMTFTTASFSLAFDFYPISSTQFALIETDGNQFLAGNVFSQPSSSIPTGTMVFTMSGATTVDDFPVANAGFLTYNSTAQPPFSGTEDVNNDGTVTPGLNFTGAASTSGSFGRTTVTLTGFTPATSWVVYPSSGGLLMLENESPTTVGVTSGVAYTQASVVALASSTGYGFNLSAFNITNGYLENDIAEFATSSSASGFTGTIDISDDNATTVTLTPNQGWSGTITGPNSSGEGSVTTTVGSLAYIGFNFYMVDSSTALVLETDSASSAVGAQIGAGMFQLQNSSSSSATSSSAMAASTKAAPVVRSLARPRAAKRLR